MAVYARNTYTLAEVADALRCDVLWLQLSLNAVGGSYSKTVRRPGDRATRELLIRFIADRPEGRESRLLAALLRRRNSNGLMQFKTKGAT